MIYFYFAAKIYMHQALFVFSQPCEGGGNLMKSLSLSLFVTIYISIIVFGVVLSLKSGKSTIVMVPLYVVIMLVITILIQKNIHHNFIVPSGTLPLARARLIDMDTNDERSSSEQATIAKTVDETFDHIGMGGGQPSIDQMNNYYLYRQPELNKLTWETAPRSCTGLEQYYRVDPDSR
jgi:hypothetical protein